MTTWLTAKKAAQYIKECNPESMIREKTIKNLVKQGFPCLKIKSRTLINVSTFEYDLDEFARAQLDNSKTETTLKITKKSLKINKSL